MRGPLPILVLAWLFPGLGHFLLGQRWRGIAFFAAITATFAFGLAITRGEAVSLDEHRLAFFAQVFAGGPALTGIALDEAAKPAVAPRYGEPPLPPEIVATIDLGLLFTMVAGLLNLLLVLDAVDRAGRPRTPEPAPEAPKP